MNILCKIFGHKYFYEVFKGWWGGMYYGLIKEPSDICQRCGKENL